MSGRRRLALGALTLTVAALAVPAALAAPGDGLALEHVDVSAYPQVVVEVAGPPVDGDAADLLALAEDGQARPVTVDGARARPLQVVLLVDTSGSMGGAPIAGARAAAQAFLDVLDDDVQVAVHRYDSDVVELTGFGDPAAAHRDAVAALEADGRTAMFDAVAGALDRLDADAVADARQAIVLLTDGEDNASEAGLDDVVDRLADGGVTLHGVEYETTSSDGVSLAAMADATGGTTAVTADADELAGIYQRLAEGLTTRYALSYRSDAHGVVELTVTLRAAETLTATRQVELPPAPDAEEPAGPAASAVPAPPGWWTALTLWGGAAAAGVAMLLLLAAALLPAARRSQLDGTARTADPVGTVAGQATALADRALEARGYRRGLHRALERAGVDLRPGELVVLVGVLGLTFALLTGALLAPAAAPVAAAFPLLVTWVTLRIRADRRQAAFAAQLPDSLQLLSGSLRAGYSFLQAVDAVAREADRPSAEEFRRVVVETRLGRDVHQALEGVVERVDSDDLRWVAQAIDIHREVGGDLAEVLDTVGDTIRERDRIRRQIKTLSAEGRLSAWVLLALPFGVGGLISVLNPSYLGQLVSGGLLGWSMVATAAVLLTVGAVWLRSLVQMRF